MIKSMNSVSEGLEGARSKLGALLLVELRGV